MPREFRAQEGYQEEAVNRDLLTDTGNIFANAAQSHADIEFSEFRKAEDLRLNSASRSWIDCPQKKVQTVTS